ncbi:MAG: hypothetical protein AAGF23_25450 [Acidobacteriota bacterium]
MYPFENPSDRPKKTWLHAAAPAVGALIAGAQLFIHIQTFSVWSVGGNMAWGPGLMLLLAAPLLLVMIAVAGFWLVGVDFEVTRHPKSSVVLGLALFVSLAVVQCIWSFHDGYRTYPASGGDPPRCFIPHP